jgi:hypothetical protein
MCARLLKNGSTLCDFYWWLAIFHIYAHFALMFLAALVILTVMLARIRILQAIKLGETV